MRGLGLSDLDCGHTWLNTNFIDSTGIFQLSKAELDTVVKDKKHKLFPSNYCLEVHLTKKLKASEK